MMNTNKHCCSQMSFLLEEGKTPICYIDIFREYKILEFDESSIFKDCFIPKDELHFGKIMSFCPWCGKKLPESLRKKWEQEVMKPYKDTDWTPNISCVEIPDEYLSSEWWEKSKS